MTLPRRLCCALLGVVLLGSLLAPAAPPAAARASHYLCTGYTGCADAGYPHHGYKKASRKMWWRMYSGHNCTNYVAYRMVKGGMSAERPWSGSGMAYHWGRANRRITDDRPMVGAVAWWRRNAPGAGSSGHVAFVEKVLSRRKIVVSEDSWSGDFHWRRITKRGSGWPTGFIHFNDRAVEPVVRPSVTGTPAVGRTLTASPGRWTPAAKYRYQWLAGGRPLAGATGTQLELTPQLRGERIAVRVWARAYAHLEGRAVSERTGRVQRGTMTVTAKPTVTGTARVGETLRLERGSWSPAPDSVEVRWFAGSKRIPGAREPRLTLERGWLGKRITARTIARTEGYRPSRVDAAPTREVREGRFEVSEPFTVSGRATRGGRLTVEPGRYRPAEAEVGYTWLRSGKPVRGADRASLELGTADVGETMSVRVRLRHPGYRDHVEVVEVGGRVTTTPRLRVAAVGRPGRVVVRLRVEAPGVASPGGPVTVRVGGREVHGKVSNGRLRLVVHDLPKGRYRAKVAYGGTAVVLPADDAVAVRVPKR